MAKRDKLTQKQKRQIAKTQKRKAVEKSPQLTQDNAGTRIPGVLVSRFGEQADVMSLLNNEVYRCFLRQNLGAPVPGDRVNFLSDSPGIGVIESIEERISLLQRPSAHQGLKPVVANIDRVFVVFAPLPEFSSILLDRYLVAIENADIEIIILLNKCDMQNEIEAQSIDLQLNLYSKINYSVIRISTHNEEGKIALIGAMVNHASILVGQSGVGKSSIINWLFPNKTLETKMVSENSKLGQHTTTASQLFYLSEQPIELNSEKENHKDGNFIIDSPGIREFGLWHLDETKIAQGFREFRDYLGGCKYRDCRHINEPGCQLIAAVKERKINSARWENYKKIITKK